MQPGVQLRATALELVRPIVQGRTVVLTGAASGSAAMAQFLADAGAFPTRVDLAVASRDTRRRFAAYEWLLEHPAPRHRELIDSVDSTGAALVYAGSFTSARQFCGRQIIGARSVEHMRAERKDWQHRVLGFPGELASLAEGLEHCLGVDAVVQGVPDYGVAMATSHTYLVPADARREAVNALAAQLSQGCSGAIVSAFNFGLPCTFYGVVTETAVIDFGPVEALVSWNPRDWRIHAPGILRPVTLDRSTAESARQAVHGAARALRDAVGYIGAFGVDGTLTEAGYAIHEINPRVCAGFALLDRLSPSSTPLASIDLALREVPGASELLANSLDQTAAVIATDKTATYRLWARPNTSTSPGNSIGLAPWKRQVRGIAAGDHTPLVDMKETAPWT